MNLSDSRRFGGGRFTPTKSSQVIVAYLFLVPVLLGLLLFRFFPIFLGFYESLYQISYTQEGGRNIFVGLWNYIDLLGDPIFMNALKKTLIFNLFINPIQITAALILAILLQKNNRSDRIFRTLFMLPLGISISIASSIWRILLNPGSGLINSILTFFAIPSQPLLTSETQALWCIILVASWCGISYWMLFLLIPNELY